MRRRQVMLRTLGMLLVFAGLCLSSCGKNQAKQAALEPIIVESAESEDSGDEFKEAQIYVHVCGAVVNAGVYAMPINSRLYEAIQLAGGFAEGAAVEQINQAEVLQDEAYVYVPTEEEVASGMVDELSAIGTKTDKVDLNCASKEELMTIPGVGEAKASQIIGYRKEHGKFQTIEDIMKISGIKEGLFEKIKDYIKV